MNKYINKDVGINAISSYKERQILQIKKGKELMVDLMQFYLEQRKKNSFMKK